MNHNNQKMNKTSMKDVQQQNFLFKTAIRMTEMFSKPCFSVFICLFLLFFFSRLLAFKIDERASQQDLR